MRACQLCCGWRETPWTDETGKGNSWAGTEPNQAKKLKCRPAEMLEC